MHLKTIEIFFNQDLSQHNTMSIIAEVYNKTTFGTEFLIIVSQNYAAGRGQRRNSSTIFRIIGTTNLSPSQVLLVQSWAGKGW